VTSGVRILPTLRESLATKAEKFLAQIGATVIKNNKVLAVEPANAGMEGALISNATLTLADGSILQADLYIPATGTKPNTGFIDESLLKDGRVETNPSTLRVDKAGPRIYAIGDVASYARPAVHGILGAVPVLAANLKRDLLGTGEDRVFEEDVRETQLVPIGRSKGVGAAMGYQLSSFLVWLIKGRDYWLWTTGKLWSGEQWT
jgi:NADH dehydrogenase FAD-containing subunit